MGRKMKSPQQQVPSIIFEPVAGDSKLIRALTYRNKAARPVETIVRVLRLKKKGQRSNQPALTT